MSQLHRRPDEPRLPVRILELGSAYCTATAGRLWAGLGAEVILWEPVAGPQRDADDLGSPNRAYFHAGKRSVATNLNELHEMAALERLAASCDIVVGTTESFRTAGLDPATFGSPRCAVVVEVRDTDPSATGAPSDGVDYARSGYMYAHGLPDRPPLVAAGHQGQHIVGLHLAIAMAAGLYARYHGTDGNETQHILVSITGSLVNIHQISFCLFTYRNEVLERSGNHRRDIFPLGFFRAADGWIAIAAATQVQWRALCHAAGQTAFADDPRVATPAMRHQHQDLILAWLSPWLASQTRDELRETLQLYRVPCEPVVSPEDTLTHPQLNHRSFFQQDSTGTLIPSAPFRITTVPWKQLPAPTRGQNNTLLKDLPKLSSLDAAERPKVSNSQSLGPLSGLKVLDFTQTWAGPLCTRILGDLGATILKVEAPNARGSLSQPQGGAILPTDLDTTQAWNKHGLFNELNRNKRSIVIDLGKPEGISLVRSLVPWANVVVDNFSARVMGNFGLAFEHLRELNPEIVAMSMPAYGLTGPYAASVGYGPTMEAASGLAWFCRYRGLDEPFRCGPAYPDPVAGLNGAYALLVGLVSQNWHSRGAVGIDLSQMESTVCAIGDLIVQSQGAAQPVTPLGDSHSHFAPWTSFRCADGRWVFIGVESDQHWLALIEAAQLPAEWKPMSQTDRRAKNDEIESAIQRWAAILPAAEVEALLKASTVPASAVLSGADLIRSELADPQGDFVLVDHPVVGPRLQPSSPFRWREQSSWPSYRPAPTYGADLEWAITQVLQLPPSTVADLVQNEVCFLEPPS